MHKIYIRDTVMNPAAKQREGALAGGAKDRDIWEDGKGAETFVGCVNAFRTDGGTLGLVGGLAVLADTRKDMMERVRYLQGRKIDPCDQDVDGTLRRYSEFGGDLVDEAMRKINGSHAMKLDRKRPGKIGRKGGKRRAEEIQKRRSALIADDILDNILRLDLPVREISRILGGSKNKFSPKTVWRMRRELLGQ